MNLTGPLVLAGAAASAQNLRVHATVVFVRRPLQRYYIDESGEAHARVYRCVTSERIPHHGVAYCLQIDSCFCVKSRQLCFEKLFGLQIGIDQCKIRHHARLQTTCKTLGIPRARSALCCCRQCRDDRNSQVWRCSPLGFRLHDEATRYSVVRVGQSRMRCCWHIRTQRDFGTAVEKLFVCKLTLASVLANQLRPAAEEDRI